MFRSHFVAEELTPGRGRGRGSGPLGRMAVAVLYKAGSGFQAAAGPYGEHRDSCFTLSVVSVFSYNTHIHWLGYRI